MKQIPLILLWIFLGGCLNSGCGITPVPVTELANENGFDVQMGYRTDAPLILAHVRTHWTLKAGGSTLRQAESDYWEWFTMGTLPQDGANWDPGDWMKVRNFAGKKFFYADFILAGPAIVATPPPDQFIVKIRRTHALFIGGTIQGQGTGNPQTEGDFGYLAQDPDGNSPIALRLDGNGNVTNDDSAAWITANQPVGTIVNTGEQVQTLLLEHEAGWGRTAGEPDWGVEWKYTRYFGDDMKEERGSAGHRTPAAGP